MTLMGDSNISASVILHVHFRNIIQDLKKRDLYVILWTVNDPFEKKYLEEVLDVPYMTDTLE